MDATIHTDAFVRNLVHFYELTYSYTGFSETNAKIHCSASTFERKMRTVSCLRLPFPAFALPLRFPPGINTASIGAICLTGHRDEGFSADRALLGCDENSALQSRFQQGIRRQKSFPKVAAQRTCPPFIPHIAWAIQRKAYSFSAVIIGASIYQPPDCRPLGACQLLRYRADHFRFPFVSENSSLKFTYFPPVSSSTTVASYVFPVFSL